MNFPYLPSTVNDPIPSLGGSRTRWRPIIAIRITGSTDSWLCDALLDSGADDTVFDEDLAAILGVDLDRAHTRQLVLAGRPQPIVCRYAPVGMQLTDGRRSYAWTAVVGFVATRLRYPLLGYAGCLRFFDVELRGADRRADLTPNHTFPGTVS